MVYWNIDKYRSPRSFGADPYAEVASSSKLQAWINAQIEMQNGSYNQGSIVELDPGPGRYLIDSPLVIPTVWNLSSEPWSLKVIGSGWTSEDYPLTINTVRSEIRGLTVNCNGLSNGIYDNSSYTLFHKPKVMRMSSAWNSSGIEKPQTSGGSTTYFSPQISQWIPSVDADKFLNKANFTADLLRINKSDTMVVGGELFWGRACYVGNNGNHTLNGVHLVNGGFTDTILIEWAKNGAAGQLECFSMYHDNGASHFYNSNVDFMGRVLIDPADVTLTTGVFNCYRGSIDEPRMKGRVTFAQFDNTDLFTFADYGGNVWSAAVQAVATDINYKVRNSDTTRHTWEFGNDLNRGSWNVAQSHETVFSPDSGYYDARKAGGMAYKPMHQEPTTKFAGMLYWSDGTSSTNGFGAAGEGPYAYVGSVWKKVQLT